MCNNHLIYYLTCNIPVLLLHLFNTTAVHIATLRQIAWLPPVINSILGTTVYNDSRWFAYLWAVLTVLVYYHYFILFEHCFVFYSWSLLEITASWVLLWCARKQPSKYWLFKITVSTAVHVVLIASSYCCSWENSNTSWGKSLPCTYMFTVFWYSLVLGCLSPCLNVWWFLESAPFVCKFSIVCIPPSVSSHPICSMMELFRMESLLVSASCKS